MDKSHGPRMHTYQSSFGGTVPANKDGGFGYVGVPTAVKRDFGAGASATDIEFKAHAKQFKRSQLKSKMLKKLAIFGVFLGILILALGAVGFALNQKYSGRALPYSYIGDISIGGLTEAEIKAALDLRAEQAEITFTEAGLTKKVDPAVFSTWFNTEKTAKDAIVGFNPFTYLTPRNFKVPVTVDENQVDGYLRLYVSNKQTPSKDAELIKQDDKLAIMPEVNGFKTNVSYVAKELQEQFAQMKDPTVSLSAAYEQPQITQEDLQDDLEKANAMVSTDVSVQVWSTKVSPSLEDKISWLNISKNDDNEVNIEFNQAKVREYIFGLADKYTYDKEDEIIAVTENGSQYIKEGKNGQKVKNIEKVFSGFYQALNDQRNGLFAFEFDYTEYAKIDRDSVNLITVVEEEEAVKLIEEEAVQEETLPSESEIPLEDQVSLNPAGNQRSNR